MTMPTMRIESSQGSSAGVKWASGMARSLPAAGCHTPDR